MSLIALLASSAVFAQEANSPFQFKKPAPPTAQAAVVATIPEDADLTPKQRETVTAMITSFADTLKITPERNVPFEVDGRRYLLLQDGQTYLGQINGQHIVYDEVAKDYVYHSASEISKIIRGDEFTRMKDDALLELEKLQQSLLKGSAGPGDAQPAAKPSEIPVVPDENLRKTGVVHKGKPATPRKEN